jgi:hypothetical protein
METLMSTQITQPHDFKFNMTNLKLAFIGDSNWDIYANADGKLFSVGKPERRGTDGRNMDTHYGDKYHIRRLMDKGYFDGIPTEVGLELMSGLHCLKHNPSKGKPFTMLVFS